MLTSRIPERAEKLPRLAYDAFEMITRVADMIAEAVEPFKREIPKINIKMEETINDLDKTKDKLNKFKVQMDKMDKIIDD